MAQPIQYGEYSAYLVNNSIRYQYQGNLIKAVQVPKQLQDYFKGQLGVEDKPAAPSRFDQATAPQEAEKVIEAENGLTAADFAEAEAMDNAQNEPKSIEVSAPSQTQDPLPQGDMPGVNVEHQSKAYRVIHPVEYPRGVAHGLGEIIWLDDHQAAGFAPGLIELATETGQAPALPAATDTAHMAEKRLPPGVPAGTPVIKTPDVPTHPVAELELQSIHNVPLEELARAMYDRFGIYTVFLRQYPQTEEISPITGEPMTQYERGVAYQAARRAYEQGRLDRTNYVAIRDRAERSRQSSREFNAQAPQPHLIPTINPEQAPKDSFAYRTSVKGGNAQPPIAPPIQHVTDETGKVSAVRETPNGMASVRHPEEEEPLAEPRMGGAPLIRPNW